jgi:putative membrane protein
MKKNLSSCLLSAAIMAASFGGVATAQTNPSAQSDRAASPTASARSDAPDAKFVVTASAAGMAEVALGKLGAAQGGSSEVKAFGQQMVTDHTKANDELKSIASAKGLPLAPTPPPSDTKAAAIMSKKSGAEFDADFKTRMVADHKKVVTLFEKEAKSGDDPELKAFASKTLPILQHHLEMAQQLPAGK